MTVVRNDLVGLTRTIASILSTNLQDIVKEILIVDGNSTDGSLTYAKKLALECETVKLLIAPPKGIYDAMNKALEFLSISSDLPDEPVLFLNAGDYLMNAENLRRLTQIVSSAHWATGHATLIRFGNYPNCVTPKLTYQNVAKPNPHHYWIPHQALLTRLSDFRQVGFFDLNFKIASDYDFMTRFWIKFGPPLVLDEVVSCQVLNGVSNLKTHSAHREKNEISMKFELTPVALGLRTKIKWWLRETIFSRFPRANPEIRAELQVTAELKRKSCHEQFEETCPWCYFLRLLNFGILYNWVD